MVHMPSLETWEWGLKIFDGAPTLTTHVDHLHVHIHMYTCTLCSTYIYVHVQCNICVVVVHTYVTSPFIIPFLSVHTLLKDFSTCKTE